MVKPVLVCVPQQMANYQLGAAGARRHAGILLGTGGTHSAWCPKAVGCFPQEYTPVMCRDFVPEFTPELISHPLDLVNRFGLLSAVSGGNVSSLCGSPVLFDRTLSQPVLSDLGILGSTGVHFDVSGPVLHPGDDSVRAGPSLLLTGDTSDGDQLPVTTATCTLTGGFVCCGWLQFVTCGAGPMAPPISGRARTVVISYGGWVRCIWIVYTRRISVEVLQVTGSLVLRILLWCLVIVCFRLRRMGLTVTKTLPVLSCWPVHSAGYNWLCMVTVYITGGTMASGDAGGRRPRDDRTGVSFRCELQTSWNTPKSYVDLESPGVVEFDTSVVPDVLGLRAFYDDAEPVRVLPGSAQNSVRVLVPDARAKHQGFHDVTLQDITIVTGPAVSTAEMCDLRRLWPHSLLSEMTRQQTDLELLRR